ncbi:hypothetical protein DSB67_09260 [Vibrio campbellii]|nr:hypothetical protein DSB67_09260 [Vibrio campbellii]
MFKRDSQRVAFLLCVVFGVLGGMRRLWYCVAHTLTGRYILRRKLGNRCNYKLGSNPDRQRRFMWKY